MKITALGIRFPDNDYINSIQAWLKVIADQEIQSYNFTSKQQIVGLFNKSIDGIYWLVQNKMRYDVSRLDASYLTITEENVYLNEEVDKYLIEQGRNLNCEFHVVYFYINAPWYYIYSH